jgi:hypothetical protein
MGCYKYSKAKVPQACTAAVLGAFAPAVTAAAAARVVSPRAAAISRLAAEAGAMFAAAAAAAARFDGDGMVYAVRIKDGAASYCNRWVPTSRLAQVRSKSLLCERCNCYI